MVIFCYAVLHRRAWWCSYGVVCNWDESIHHEGSGQMHFLKRHNAVSRLLLMESDDFPAVIRAKEKRTRALYSRADHSWLHTIILAMSSLDTHNYTGRDMWWINPCHWRKVIWWWNALPIHSLLRNSLKLRGDDTDSAVDKVIIKWTFPHSLPFESPFCFIQFILPPDKFLPEFLIHGMLIYPLLFVIEGNPLTLL